jgi:hypothetical protein
MTRHDGMAKTGDLPCLIAGRAGFGSASRRDSIRAIALNSNASSSHRATQSTVQSHRLTSRHRRR